MVLPIANRGISGRWRLRDTRCALPPKREDAVQTDGDSRRYRAKLYRDEATRIRARADTIKDDAIRRELLAIALEYDLLAIGVEHARY